MWRAPARSPRIKRWTAAPALLAIAWLLGPAPLAAASRFDPAYRFRTISTEHFVIYFHRGEERLAARLAVVAEEIRRALQPTLGVPMQRRTHVVLVDQSELANGWASPTPFNTIAIGAAAPSGSEWTGYTDDWLRVVFAHEYAHIVHLDRSGGWSRFVRTVFGRTPLAFPNLFLPIWQIEGLATLEESRLTGQGRLHAGDFRMIEREARRVGAVEIDRVNGGLTTWPDGHAAYAYGAGFHDYLARTYGEHTPAALADRTVRRVPYFTSGAFPQIFGKTLGTLWDEYQGSIRPSANAGAGAAERRTRHGYTVTGPRFLPRRCETCPWEVAYSIRTPHGFPSLNAVALDGSPPRELAPRFLGSTLGVGGGILVFDQQEIRRNVGLYSDLYTVDRVTGAVVPLTSGARLLDPDLSPDGSTVAAVREGSATRDLVTLAMTRPTAVGRNSHLDVAVLISEPDTRFSAPRWSPDGRSLAVERQRLGRMSEIVVVDVATRAVRVVASHAATRYVTPAWRPDGNALVVAAAAPNEPFNLYEVDLAPTPTARPLTAAATGALWPDVSADGTLLVFVGYTADGFDLFSLPYPPPPSGSSDRSPTIELVAPAPASNAGEATNSRRYTPLSTLAPTSWLPVVETDNDQLRIGAATGGSDVLGYHAYAAALTWRASAPTAIVDSGTAFDWEVAYVYDRWQPAVVASASAETVFVSVPSADGAVNRTAVRSREAEAALVVPFRRVRISHLAIASLARTLDDYALPDAALAIRRTAIRGGWSSSSARLYGFSISPEDGLTAGVTAEGVPDGLGSSGSASTLTGDLRAYLPGAGRHHVVALRAGGGLSNGDAGVRSTFRLGGASPSGGVLNFDDDAFSLLRGFEPDTFFGRRVAVVNAEYRWPLSTIERGFRTWPLFLHTVHTAGFADFGHAWSESFRLGDVKRALGGELSADIVAGYSLRLTLTAGAAWGRDGARRDGDRTTFYLRLGRAF